MSSPSRFNNTYRQQQIQFYEDRIRQLQLQNQRMRRNIQQNHNKNNYDPNSNFNSQASNMNQTNFGQTAAFNTHNTTYNQNNQNTIYNKTYASQGNPNNTHNYQNYLNKYRGQQTTLDPTTASMIQMQTKNESLEWQARKYQALLKKDLSRFIQDSNMSHDCSFKNKYVSSLRSNKGYQLFLK